MIYRLGQDGSLTGAFAGQLPAYNGLTIGPRSTGEFDFNTPYINGSVVSNRPRDYGDPKPSDRGDLIQARPITQQGPITPIDAPLYNYNYGPNGPKITR